MIGYILRRLGLVLVVLVGVVSIVFFAQRLSGDPVGLLLPVDATDQQRTEMARALGLDRPLIVQYLRYLGGGGNLTEYEGIANFFMENLKAFKENKPLKNQITLGKGY